MKKFIYIIIIVSIISIILTGCNNKTEVSQVNVENKSIEEIEKLKNEILSLKTETNEKEHKIKKLEEDIQNLKEESNQKNSDMDLKYIIEERDYYRLYIDKYLQKLSNEELLNIAKTEWTYSLYIKLGTMENKSKVIIEIPKDGIIEVKESSFLLTISEHQSAFPILNNYIEIYNKGSIENYSNHLKILDNKNYISEGYSASGTIVDSLTYEFLNVPKGSKIKLEISEELKERLNLNTNIIMISVK